LLRAGAWLFIFPTERQGFKLNASPLYSPRDFFLWDGCVSEKARFITGHIMHVSGGAEIGYKR